GTARRGSMDTSSVPGSLAPAQEASSWGAGRGWRRREDSWGHLIPQHAQTSPPRPPSPQPSRPTGYVALEAFCAGRSGERGESGDLDDALPPLPRPAATTTLAVFNEVAAAGLGRGGQGGEVCGKRTVWELRSVQRHRHAVRPAPGTPELPAVDAHHDALP